VSNSYKNSSTVVDALSRTHKKMVVPTNCEGKEIYTQVIFFHRVQILRSKSGDPKIVLFFIIANIICHAWCSIKVVLMVHPLKNHLNNSGMLEIF